MMLCLSDICFRALKQACGSQIFTVGIQKRLVTRLLLARLMGQYCFTRCRLSASSVTHVGGRPQPGRALGRSSGRHCKRDSTVTSH